MVKKRTDEQSILREVGIYRAAYRGTWVYESFGDAPNGNVILVIYYEVTGEDISSDIKHWRDIPRSRAAINSLLSAMNLKENLPLPHVKHGRYYFLNALKPAAFSSAKEVEAAASASAMKWTLALWDEDKQTISVVKYRS